MRRVISKNKVKVKLSDEIWAHNIAEPHDYMAESIDKIMRRGYNMEEVKSILESAPYLLNMPSKRMWVDHDEGDDVLCISFQKTQV